MNELNNEQLQSIEWFMNENNAKQFLNILEKSSLLMNDFSNFFGNKEINNSYNAFDPVYSCGDIVKKGENFFIILEKIDTCLYNALRIGTGYKEKIAIHDLKWINKIANLELKKISD